MLYIAQVSNKAKSEGAKHPPAKKVLEEALQVADKKLSSPFSGENSFFVNRRITEFFDFSIQVKRLCALVSSFN